MKMKINSTFFQRDGYLVAQEIIGKLLCVNLDGTTFKYRITEVELYSGESDSACHASKGKTNRTEIMYEKGGYLYVYLCYGIHNLLNVVTGDQGYPEAILIRGIEDYNGPGKLTKALNITREHNKLFIDDLDSIWFEDDKKRYEIETTPRVGIGYATKENQNKLWRFSIKKEVF